MEIIVRNNQSLLDIAIQYRGTALAAFEIALANDISLTQDLETAQRLLIPNTRYYNETIADCFLGKGFFPACGVTDDFINNLDNPGIGEMVINVNFMAKPFKDF